MKTFLVPGLGLAAPLWENWTGHPPTAVLLLPGYGRPWPFFQRDRGVLVSARGLLESLPAGPVVLVGHSLSAWMVLEAARLRPDKVRGVVLCAPANRSPSVLVTLVQLLFSALQKDQASTLMAMGCYLQTGPLSMLTTFLQGRKYPYQRTLQDLRVPVLILQGSRDPLSPPHFGRSLVLGLPPERRPLVSVQPVADANHLLVWTHAPGIIARVEAWQREHSLEGGIPSSPGSLLP